MRLGKGEEVHAMSGRAYMLWALIEVVAGSRLSSIKPNVSDEVNDYKVDVAIDNEGNLSSDGMSSL